ncbi:hypothetical protein ACD591_09000 [Rufibacter glacialis]|uniref:Uncharacterized protein n=1 Tax=Rufibacter glacialis TaxID=1259555 RepID=A0A5M8Q915_9BACT|nr:hypothetical protein [Rufibacter glacialis]KAA6432427.1 hypothetical protein FOE74_15110 [Rufibacter glacialis]GGK78580.1 hypothetical protein GCM10011405_28060 [Rufibacter glacialis]
MNITEADPWGILSPQTLYEDAVFRLQLDKRHGLLLCTFFRNPTPEEFRNSYRLAFDCARLKEVTLWLTDARNITSMLPDNQRWLKQHMATLFAAGLLCKFAIVMAPECFVMTDPH